MTRSLIVEHIDAFIAMSGQLNNDYWTLDHYLADLEKKWDLSSVVFMDGVLCGFIIVSEKEHSLHINRIVVDKAYQQYGIGRQLVQKAILDCKASNKSLLTLKVDQINKGAIHFYEKLHFTVTGKQGELLLMELKTDA